MSERPDLGTEERDLRIQRMAAEIRAPASLRERVAELEQRHARSSRRRLGAFATAAAGALAAVVVALSVGGGGGGAGAGPSFAQAAALASAAPTMPAPTQDSTHPAALSVAVDGQAYPYWGDKSGFQGVGARRDRLGGREAVTVYYAQGSRRVGYTIVSGPGLPVPYSREVTRAGVTYQVLAGGGSPTVTWRRGGHTCILVGRGVAAQGLLALASSPGAA